MRYIYTLAGYAVVTCFIILQFFREGRKEGYINMTPEDFFCVFLLSSLWPVILGGYALMVVVGKASDLLAVLLKERP